MKQKENVKSVGNIKLTFDQQRQRTMACRICFREFWTLEQMKKHAKVHYGLLNESSHVQPKKQGVVR